MCITSLGFIFMADHTHEHAGGRPPESFEVRILRQDGPGQASYWERFRVNYEPDMNVISVLQRIAARPVTTEGKQVTPVAWDSNCLEEVCGACTMLVNGRVRQSCSALVERLLEEEPEGIELQPMTRFPVLRDLVVDRTRLFRALTKIRGWVPVDGYYDMGPAPRQAPQVQEMRYPLSECMSCGCCLEACPQYNKIELDRREGKPASNSSSGRRPPTIVASSAPTPSARWFTSTAIRSANRRRPPGWTPSLPKAACRCAETPRTASRCAPRKSR
jgi:succinate dehydrogenase / fumarate reductase, iron-sulfur subunit